MDENILKTFSRLKDSADGIDFIAYLELLSKENYAAFKCDKQEMNDIHKGYAIAIDCLLETFNNCDNALQLRELKIDNELVNMHY